MSSANMNIPPGISFLIKRLPQLLSPPAVAFLLIYLYRNSYLDNYGLGSARADHELSTLFIAIVYVLSFPAALTISVAYSAIANRIAAARMGAVMLPTPPFMDDPTPGGLLSLYRAIKGFKGGYPGMYFCYDSLPESGALTIYISLFFSRRFGETTEYYRPYIQYESSVYGQGE